MCSQHWKTVKKLMSRKMTPSVPNVKDTLCCVDAVSKLHSHATSRTMNPGQDGGNGLLVPPPLVQSGWEIFSTNDRQWFRNWTWLSLWQKQRWSQICCAAAFLLSPDSSILPPASKQKVWSWGWTNNSFHFMPFRPFLIWCVNLQRVLVVY